MKAKKSFRIGKVRGDLRGKSGISPIANSANGIVLALVTRKPQCPSCNYGVSRKDSTCPHCGCSLTPPEEP